MISTVRSFARRRGRITKAQEDALSNARKTFYSVPFSESPLDFAALFGNNNPVYCEIGFGGGEAAAEIAAANLNKNYFCIDVYESGAGKLFIEIEKRALKNIRVIIYDAVEVLNFMVKNESIAGFHIFFPDPWQKKRHHKRRLIQRPFTNLLVHKLSQNGYIYFVTDWSDYAQQALFELTQTEGLVNKYSEYSPRQFNRPITKFEKRAIKERRQVRELFFIKQKIFQNFSFGKSTLENATSEGANHSPLG